MLRMILPNGTNLFSGEISSEEIYSVFNKSKISTQRNHTKFTCKAGNITYYTLKWWQYFVSVVDKIANTVIFGQESNQTGFWGLNIGRSQLSSSALQGTRRMWSGGLALCKAESHPSGPQRCCWPPPTWEKIFKGFSLNR